MAASYNMGYDGLKRLIDKQRVTSYYETEMNTQTGRYVFRMLALKEIMDHPSKYGFYYLKRHLYYPIPTDKITISSAIPDLVDWSIKAGINYKVLREFNPWLKTYSLNSASASKTYIFEIPKDRNIMPDNMDDDTAPVSVVMPEMLGDSAARRR